MSTFAPQPAAAAPYGDRPSLLFGPALPRRQSLLLPERGPRGRCRHVQAREAAIAAFLASLPPGAAVSVCQVLREVPGLRLLPSQAGTIAATLRALGWRAGNGFAEFVREGEAPAARRASNLHPEIARRLPAIRAFVADRREVTAGEVASAAGISLPGQRQRAVARALARLGFVAPGRGSVVWTRGAAQ